MFLSTVMPSPEIESLKRTNIGPKNNKRLEVGGDVNPRILCTPPQKMDTPIISTFEKEIQKKKVGNPPVRGV